MQLLLEKLKPQAGHSTRFAQIVRDIVEQRLEVRYDPPPAGDAAQHRRAVLEEYISRRGNLTKASVQYRLKVFDVLLNGDFGNRQKIIHHCQVPASKMPRGKSRLSCSLPHPLCKSKFARARH